MKVYIQKYEGQFLDDLFFNADMGFRKLGADIKYFEDIDTVPFSKDIVVVAFIEDTIKYFQSNGIEVPKPLNIPNELNQPEYLRRKIQVGSFADFKKNAHTPIFIKPADQVKQFSSGVLSDMSTVDLSIGLLPNETTIMTSELIEFYSEYRCFVYDQKLVGLKHYTGSFKMFPNISSIYRMIEDYKSAPIAYTLDVGIVNNPYDDGIALVECNDFWSIGSYGFDAVLYAKMLRDRWFEIIRK